MKNRIVIPPVEVETKKGERVKLLGLDAARVLIERLAAADERIAALERRGGRAGVVTTDTAAKAGEFLNIEARSGALLTIVLPESTPALRGARVTLSFRTANPVRIVAVSSTVNREPFVINEAVGTYDAIADGLGGWAVSILATPEGIALPPTSPGGAALNAQYVLGATHASLPNAAVATDSTEVDVSFTPGGAASWALRTASVVLGKLANLPGLSVLGRASSSAGVMAAITATAARQTLRANDAGTALEWGNPVEVRDSGADQGDAFALDFVAGTNVNLAASVVGGVATVTPSVDLSSVTYTAGDGIDLVGNQFSADVSDFAGTGLEHDGSNNLRIAAAAAGAGLTGGGGSALAVGAGTRITINANDVQLAAGAAESFLGNFTAGSAVADYRAGSSVAGGGLTYTAGGTLAVGAGTHITVNANDVAVDVATLLAAIDSTSIVVSGSTLQTAAVTGAISKAQNATASLFAGIRDNGSLETARTFLNFVSTSFDTTFSVTQDAGNDELEVRVSTLGSFYSENSVGSIQTKFISFDDGDLLQANVTDNTGGSGFINVTFDLNLSTDTAIANIGEGATSTGEARVSRDDMCRWLSSQANVRVFEEEFFGNLAASTARFTVVSGFSGFPALSAVSNGEFTAGINLQNTSPAGTTRGVWTLGADENALNFNWDSLRYLCIVFRAGSSTVVANTQWALGLVGPFASYGAVTASALGGTSEGVFIEYVTTLSSGQFRVGRRSSSTTSVTSTGVAVAANTRYVYELFRTAAGVDYHYLDGTLMRTDASGIAPSGTGCTFFATILGSTTATRNFQIDAIKVVSQSANRSG